MSRRLSRWFWGYGLLAWLTCACGQCGADSSIPPEGLVDARPRSARVLWTADPSQWSSQVPAGSRLRVYQVELTNGQIERRVLFQASRQPAQYLGALTHQLGQAPVETMLIEIGADRFIVGRVDETISGQLAFVDMERVEPHRPDWMKATKSSTVKSRVFILPIFADQTEQWNQLARVAIKTRESLAQGVKNPALGGSAWEVVFEPPLDISTFWVSASLNVNP